MRESSERAFKAYWEPLENFAKFRYLGQVLTAGDDDWIAVVGKLGKAQHSWGWLSRILRLEGSDPKVSGSFYKAVVQVVLLFGAETWVLTPRMKRSLDSFQHRVARRITGRQPQRRGLGSGSTRLWRSQWVKRASRGSESWSQGGRPRPRNILWRDQFWTYVSGPLGGQERVCLDGCVNKPALTWKGRRRWRRRQRRSRSWS